MAAQVIPMDRGRPWGEVGENWKKSFLEFMGLRMEAMEDGRPIERLRDISRMLFDERSEILGQLALAFIRKRFGHLLSQEFFTCPECGKTLKSRGNQKRGVITVAARFELERPYFYCVGCRKGYHPLDEALELTASARQEDVLDLAAWLGKEMPYETTAEAMKRASGIGISPAEIHETVEGIGSGMGVLDLCPSKEEVLTKIEEFREGRRRRPVMMMAVDGAHAPVRPEPSPYKGKRGKGDYREVKGFRIYLLDKHRIEHLISWHQIGTADDLASALKCLKDAGLVPENRVRLCVVADGAAWIWNRLKEVFPSAREVLDYYHCAEHLHALANAQYGNGTLKAREWVEATLARLFLKQGSRVIAGIRRMKPSSSDAAKLIKSTSEYLKGHAKRLDYGGSRKGGYPIGSGAIESANKLICHTRLKRPGAWWYPTNVNNVLKLRCAAQNHTFTKATSLHWKDLLKKTYAHADPVEPPPSDQV